MSNYSSFEVKVDNDDGTTTPLAGVTVEVRDVSNAGAIVTLASVVSGSDGVVAGGSVARPVGATLRFTYKSNTDGRCGYAETITTA